MSQVQLVHQRQRSGGALHLADGDGAVEGHDRRAGETEDLERHAGAARVAEDVDGADLSNVSGTPTFFINGRRHCGAYDINSLTQAVRAARARATITA